MELTRLHVAESGIRQLHARCADAVWRKDADGFANCFTENGEWIIAGIHFRGRAQLASGFKRFLDLNQRVLMRFGTPILTLGDPTVLGRTYVIEDIKTLDNRGMKTIGIYHERFVLQGDQWLFQWRHFDTHYHGPPDLSEPLTNCPDHGPPPGMPGMNG